MAGNHGIFGPERPHFPGRALGQLFGNRPTIVERCLYQLGMETSGLKTALGQMLGTTKISASSELHCRGDRLICSGVTAAPEERRQTVDGLLIRLERSSRWIEAAFSP